MEFRLFCCIAICFGQTSADLTGVMNNVKDIGPIFNAAKEWIEGTNAVDNAAEYSSRMAKMFVKTNYAAQFVVGLSGLADTQELQETKKSYTKLSSQIGSLGTRIHNQFGRMHVKVRFSAYESAVIMELAGLNASITEHTQQDSAVEMAAHTLQIKRECKEVSTSRLLGKLAAYLLPCYPASDLVSNAVVADAFFDILKSEKKSKRSVRPVQDTNATESDFEASEAFITLVNYMMTHPAMEVGRKMQMFMELMKSQSCTFEECEHFFPIYFSAPSANATAMRSDDDLFGCLVGDVIIGADGRRDVYESFLQIVRRDIHGLTFVGMTCNQFMYPVTYSGSNQRMENSLNETYRGLTTYFNEALESYWNQSIAILTFKTIKAAGGMDGGATKTARFIAKKVFEEVDSRGPKTNYAVTVCRTKIFGRYLNPATCQYVHYLYEETEWHVVVCRRPNNFKPSDANVPFSASEIAPGMPEIQDKNTYSSMVSDQSDQDDCSVRGYCQMNQGSIPLPGGMTIITYQV